jgi:hypothetical protein
MRWTGQAAQGQVVEGGGGGVYAGVIQ